MYLSGVVSLDERATRVAALTSGRVQEGAMLRCDEGRVLVKEYVGALGAAAGITELKVVGSFEARPAGPAPPGAAPPAAADAISVVAAPSTSPRPSSRPPSSPPPSSPPPSSPQPSAWSSPQPARLGSAKGLPALASILNRRGSLAAAAAALTASVATATATVAWAADLQELAGRPMGGVGAAGGAFPGVLPILGAQQSARKILEDEATFKTAAPPAENIKTPTNRPRSLQPVRPPTAPEACPLRALAASTPKTGCGRALTRGAHPRRLRFVCCPAGRAARPAAGLAADAA